QGSVAASGGGTAATRPAGRSESDRGARGTGGNGAGSRPTAGGARASGGGSAAAWKRRTSELGSGGGTRAPGRGAGSLGGWRRQNTAPTGSRHPAGAARPKASADAPGAARSAGDGHLDRAAQFPEEPGARLQPIALHGAQGNAEGRGGVLLAVSGEKTAFHDLRQPRRGVRQALQRLIQGEQAFVGLDGQIGRLRQRHVVSAATAFLSEALRGMV